MNGADEPDNADIPFKTILENALVLSFMRYAVICFVPLILVIFIYNFKVRMIVLWYGITILICAIRFILASIKNTNHLKATGTVLLAVAVPLLYGQLYQLGDFLETNYPYGSLLKQFTTWVIAPLRLFQTNPYG